MYLEVMDGRKDASYGPNWPLVKDRYKTRQNFSA